MEKVLSERELQGLKVISEQKLQEMFDKAMADIGKEIEREYEQERRQRQAREKEVQRIRLLFIREMLEHYRQAPEGSCVRRTVEGLIRANKDTCRNADWDKTDHNITVLRYLVRNTLPDKEICKRLEISMASLERGNRRTIERMAILFYGIDGIGPKWTGTEGSV